MHRKKLLHLVMEAVGASRAPVPSLLPKGKIVAIQSLLVKEVQLEDQSSKSVPFEDGAYLNLWASCPTNVRNSIGQYEGVAGDSGNAGFNRRSATFAVARAVAIMTCSFFLDFALFISFVFISAFAG